MQDGSAGKKWMNPDRRLIWNVLKNWIPIYFIVFFLSIIAFYPVSEILNAKDRSSIISKLNSAIDKTDDTRKQEFLLQAHSWNELLARKNPALDADSLWPYEQQLAIDGPNAPFAWIKIPKISLEMPVYHSTSAEVLAQGVGHMESTSLPVGGSDTHAVLSAHSGMPNERAFDDIEQLEVGDFFAVNVLNDWYGYRVSDIEVVLPDESQSLAIEPGKDRMTLVTCTPYGINDHRLLVHADRSELPDDFYTTSASLASTLTNRRVWPFLAAIAAVAVTAAVLVFRPKKKNQNRTSSP